MALEGQIFCETLVRARMSFAESLLHRRTKLVSSQHFRFKILAFEKHVPLKLHPGTVSCSNLFIFDSLWPSLANSLDATAPLPPWLITLYDG